MRVRQDAEQKGSMHFCLTGGGTWYYNYSEFTNLDYLNLWTWDIQIEKNQKEESKIMMDKLGDFYE